MLCVKARLPTKQNADSQKTTCFKCFTEAPCFTQHLEKSCSCFALLSWLLLCWAARTCTLSPPMSCLCYTCLRRQNLFSCVPWPQFAPLSWLLLRFTACTCTLSLLCHVSALKVWNPNSSGRGGRRNTPTAVKYGDFIGFQWMFIPPVWW